MPIICGLYKSDHNPHEHEFLALHQVRSFKRKTNDAITTVSAQVIVKVLGNRQNVLGNVRIRKTGIYQNPSCWVTKNGSSLQEFILGGYAVNGSNLFALLWPLQASIPDDPSDITHQTYIKDIEANFSMVRIHTYWLS